MKKGWPSSSRTGKLVMNILALIAEFETDDAPDVTAYSSTVHAIVVVSTTLGCGQTPPPR